MVLQHLLDNVIPLFLRQSCFIGECTMEGDRKDDGGGGLVLGEEGGGKGRQGMKCDKGCKLDSNLQCRV